MPYRFTIRSGVCSLLFFLRVLVLAFLATRTIWVAILAPSFAATYFSVHAPGSVGWTRAELDVGHQTLPLLVLWHRALLPSMTGHLQELGEVDISRGRILESAEFIQRILPPYICLGMSLHSYRNCWTASIHSLMILETASNCGLFIISMTLQRWACYLLMHVKFWGILVRGSTVTLFTPHIYTTLTVTGRDQGHAVWSADVVAFQAKLIGGAGLCIYIR